MLTLLYFASLRERLGRAREEVAVAPAGSSVAHLLGELRARGTPWDEALASGKSWRVAVNQRMADESTALRNGDEVAFFPPVTGG
jgi:molybdopterin synthase sulfur carrier subunit